MMCIRPLTLILPLLLTACSGSQTSVERNASHAASAIERMHFDPNTRMQRADSITALKPMMQQLYDQGKRQNRWSNACSGSEAGGKLQLP
jgi:hypothetical protein